MQIKVIFLNACIPIKLPKMTVKISKMFQMKVTVILVLCTHGLQARGNVLHTCTTPAVPSKGSPLHLCPLVASKDWRQKTKAKAKERPV